MTIIQTPSRSRVFSVRHVTTYNYDRPVTRSSHRLHLRPIHDWKQSVRSYSLSVNPSPDGGDVTEFDDVFGNFAGRFDMTTPYTQLILNAQSTVEVNDIDPFEFARDLKTCLLYTSR